MKTQYEAQITDEFSRKAYVYNVEADSVAQAAGICVYGHAS